jgi:hypothetical protein
MDERSTDLDNLALALVHWLDAHSHPGDPVAGSRALDEARRRLAAYLPGRRPAPREPSRRRWLRFW